MQRVCPIFKLLSLCLLLVLSLSACKKGDGGEEDPKPSTQQTQTPTPIPTPTDKGNTGNGETGAKEVTRQALSSLALGTMHSCALTEVGNVKCWGGGKYLGNGNDTTNKLVPVDVIAAEDSANALLDDIVQVSAGRFHSCALTSGGNIKCWGDGNKGQLGNGNTANSNWPVYVIEEDGSSNTLDSIVQIAAGSFHTCALTTEGGVKCWGRGDKGELGSSTKKEKNSAPVVVMGADSQPLTGIVQLAAGFAFNCALTTEGGVKCWGVAEQGQLGNGSYEAKNVPVDVVDADNKPLTGIVQITAGEKHACALTNTANVKCWGRGNIGQLGNAKGTGTTDDVKSAHAVNVIIAAGGAPLADIVQVAVGKFYSCALTNTANVKCWGDGISLGRGDNQATKNVPVDVLLLSGIAHLAAGESHVCAVNNMGYVECWGAGHQGQLGNGETVNKYVPSDVIIEQGKPDPLKIATKRAEQVCYDDGTCKIE